MKKFNLVILAIFFVQLLSAQIEDALVKKQLEDFDKYVEQTLKDWKVPSAGVAIVKDGKIVWAKGYGFKDVENKVAATEHTLYAIGSSSKAFTAAAVCQLADEGKIDLDKPLKSYLSNFNLWDEYASENMTARDLLCHRSGLPRHDFVWYGSDKSREEMFLALKHLEPTATFRETWQYQNLMFMTAGYLVEKISGKTWEAYVQENIFDPLEMKTANFSVNDMQKETDYAFPYREAIADKEKGKVVKMDFRNIDAIGPAGSINANVFEMSNWVIMQLAKGKFNEKEIISSSMIQQMHRPHMVIPGGASDEVYYNSYGLGWFLTSYRGHVRVEHGGNIDGFSANVCLMPKDSIGVVVLTNMNGTGAPSVIRNAALDRMLELEKIDWNKRVLEDRKKAQEAAEKQQKDSKDEGKVEGTKPAHALADYLGNYDHPAYGTINVSVKDERLHISRNGLVIPMDHYHYEVFETEHQLVDKLKVTFHTNVTGEVDKVSAQMQPGVSDIEFKRIVEISEEELNVYVGEYEFSPGTRVKISVKNGILKAFIAGQPEYTLKPMQTEHTFNLEELSGFSVKFKFEKDSKNPIEAVFNQPNGVFAAKRK